MKKFVFIIILMFIINISLISNQAFAEENNQSDKPVSESNLNESNISNVDIAKYESESLLANLGTDNSSKEDVEHIISEESTFKSDAAIEESEKLNVNDTVNNENNKDNSEKQNTQSENNINEKANIESENDLESTDKNIRREEDVNDESNTLLVEKLDGNQVKNENINNLDESIIGPDDRKLVKDINKFPNKSIVFIKSYYDDINYSSGTGFIIDDNAVLTAAHVITSDFKDIEIKKIIISAGYKEEKETLGSARVIKTYVKPEWKNFRNPLFDMALLILDKPLGKELGKLKLSDKVKLGEFVSTSGYPGQNKNNVQNIRAGNQYYSSGEIVYITKNKLYYNSDTEPGQSGSPVFNDNNDVIAIHTNGFNKNSSLKFNSGIRLSSENIETIYGWISDLKSERYDKVIYVNNSGAKIWTDLNLKDVAFKNQMVNGRIYRAVTIYTDSTGEKYILLKDKDHQFVGFINVNDTTVIKPLYTDKVVQLKKENVKLYRNLFGDLQTETKLSYGSFYKIKEIYNLPNNVTLYTLCDKDGKWIGNINKEEVREVIFEPYNKRVEIIKNNYTVWGDFFEKENLNTKSMYHKIYNAKGIYKDNKNRIYVTIYDSKDRYLGILNITGTKVV